MTRDPVKIKAARDRANAARKARLRTDPAYAEKIRATDRARKKRTVPAGHRLQGISKLVDENGETLKEWQKTGLRPDEPPAFPIEPPGFMKTSQSTMVGRQGEALIQWVRFEPQKVEQWQAMWDACKAATEEYRGLVDPTPAPLVGGRLLNVIPIGDPHIGMYAWSKETGQPFDCDIAQRDLVGVISTLLSRCPPAKTCLIAQLGDFFHAEDDNARTPRGNNQLDVDTRSGRVTKIGYTVMRQVIDLALKTHENVVVLNLRGNHDPFKSVALSLYLQGIYEREPRVNVLDNYDPYIFHEHGDCLLGFHHGDGAKPEQLPAIMASWREGAPWGKAKHRRWFTGHVHSLNARDFPGVTWESFRTLAPGDFWAHWKGYRSEQSLDCLTFDEFDGLVSRQTVTLRMARRADNG